MVLEPPTSHLSHLSLFSPYPFQGRTLKCSLLGFVGIPHLHLQLLLLLQFLKPKEVMYTLPETNIAPENWWFGDYFPFGKARFQGLG